jgi:hypothetical protein
MSKLSKHFDESLKVQGFVGYKYIYSPVKRLNPSPIKSQVEAALNASYNINENFNLFAQLHYQPYNPEQSLTFAYLQYNEIFMKRLDTRLSAGKVKFDWMLHNTSRASPRARNSAVLPQAIYWDLLRYTTQSGLGVKAEIFDTKTGFFGRATIAKPTLLDTQDSYIWSSGTSATSDVGFGDIFGVSFGYAKDNLYLETGYVNVTVGPLATQETQSFWGSAEYYWEGLTGSFEVLTLRRPGSSGVGYSTTLAYDWTDKLSTHINYNQFDANFDIPRDATVLTGNTHFNHHKDLNLGVSLHLGNWEIKSGFHFVKGSTAVDVLQSLDPGYDDIWT